MDLTPDLLRTVEFNDAKKRGYDPDEVDEFLDRAAADLDRQHARLRELETRADAAEKRAVQIEAEVRERSDSDETLRRTLVLAQRTADAAIKEAQDEAARIVAEARQKADGMISSAEEQVRRDVGATRDRLQSEIRDLETRRGQLHDRITDLSAHLDTERDRLRSQLEQLRTSLDDEAMRVAPIPGADEDAFTSTEDEPVTDEVAEDSPAAGRDDTAGDDEDLSELPPPPVNWVPDDSPPAGEEAAERADEPPAQLDLSDGGPATEATPVVPAARSTGAAHIDELRRAVSEGPTREGDEDAAMAAFFDQDDDEERTRRFGRRR